MPKWQVVFEGYGGKKEERTVEADRVEKDQHMVAFTSGGLSGGYRVILSFPTSKLIYLEEVKA